MAIRRTTAPPTAIPMMAPVVRTGPLFSPSFDVLPDIAVGKDVACAVPDARAVADVMMPALAPLLPGAPLALALTGAVVRTMPTPT